MMRRKRIKDASVIRMAGQKMQLIRTKNEFDGANSDRPLKTGQTMDQDEDEDEIRVCKNYVLV